MHQSNNAHDESDAYYKKLAGMGVSRDNDEEWEPAGKFNGVETYRRKKDSNVSKNVAGSPHERLDEIQQHIGSLLKFMMGEFVKESGDLSKILSRHRDSFVDILEIYCRYVNDVVNLYDWMGLPINKLTNSPTQYTIGIKNFLYIYRVHKLADEPLSKMLNDIFSVKFNKSDE